MKRKGVTEEFDTRSKFSYRKYNMFSTRILLVFLSIFSNALANGTRAFPENFRMGCATSAYQIEGSPYEGCKSQSIWDYAVHLQESPVADKSTGDIACDSYNQYQRDVEMLRELGVDYYRFSISWPRILNTSFADHINQHGVDYYNGLIDTLITYNITPMVTIYHWDLPQKLQLMGGWTNPNIVEWYSDYARVLFTLFGDRVKHWITMNEPKEICFQGYGRGTLAPSYNITGYADYLCGRHLLLSHAKAYHIYDEEFRPTQNGTIFITLSCEWYEPDSDSEDDIAAARDMMLWDWGQYAHPIFIGDYPAIFKERIANKSTEQGFPRSRLQEFSDDEISYIKGTSDYYGLNHYAAYMTYRNSSVDDYHPIPGYYDDAHARFYRKDEWFMDKNMTRIGTTPWAFYKLLTKIYNDFNKPKIWITENGFATTPGFADDTRINHLLLYLDAMLDAIDDGAEIVAYTPWSMMDNFEWMQGYVQRFGLYEVDIDDDTRPRTPRKSAFIFKNIVKTRTLDFDYEPDNYTMTIDEGH